MKVNGEGVNGSDECMFDVCGRERDEGGLGRSIFFGSVVLRYFIKVIIEFFS